MLTENQLRAIEKGLSFQGYMDQWEDKNARSMRGLDAVARRYRFYSKYNLERQRQVETAWQPSADFRQAVHAATSGTWLFITDDWCVDSAYSLPLIHWAAELRPDIALRILLKDDHPDIMDAFLTDGKRSIPKWIGLGEGGRVLFSWGPQPEEIRVIRHKLIEEQAEGHIVSQTTVDWYADGGWLAVEKELTTILKRI